MSQSCAQNNTGIYTKFVFNKRLNNQYGFKTRMSSFTKVNQIVGKQTLTLAMKTTAAAGSCQVELRPLKLIF